MKTSKVVTTLAMFGGLGAAVAGGVSLVPQSAQARSYVRQERNPVINRAIRNLELARTDTQRANRDFGEHRAKAVRLINQAIAELNRAKRYDDRH